MPRTTNIKGLRALINHNVLKHLKRLSATEKQNVTNFINSLTLEELKQKGLTKQIVTQFKDGKPRKVLSGGMNRDEHLDRPITRGYVRTFIDKLKGISSDERKYTVHKRKQELNDRIEEEKDLEKKLKIAKIRTADARRQESLIQSKLNSKKMELDIEYEQTRDFISINEHLIKDIPPEQKSLFKEYNSIVTQVPEENYDDWKQVIDTIVQKMLINDRLYFELTHNYLVHHDDLTSIVLFNKPQASSSSSSLPSSSSYLPIMEPPAPESSEDIIIQPEQVHIIPQLRPKRPQPKPRVPEPMQEEEHERRADRELRLRNRLEQVKE